MTAGPQGGPATGYDEREVVLAGTHSEMTGAPSASCAQQACKAFAVEARDDVDAWMILEAYCCNRLETGRIVYVYVDLR